MTVTPVKMLLSRLSGVAESGNGWSARCPAHDDRRASLSISEGDDGRALVRCHAGCTAEAVCDALGLRTADLMPRRDNRPDDPRRNPRGRIDVRYVYHDEKGSPLFRVCRMDPKDFRQQRLDHGTWKWGVQGIRKVPYRLPDLAKADLNRPVLIVEGEKDADRLAALGYIATTNPGGAGKWLPEYNEHFCDRRVAILPDNDLAGRKHADQVARSLHPVAAEIRIVSLPGLPEKGDVSDWLDAGGTVEKLREAVQAAPDWNPASARAARGPDGVDDGPPPYEPFPTDALPEPARSFVEEGAKALGCDASYIALPLLSALASAVGNTRRIELKTSWQEPCIIWTVCVGDSGTLKSPAFDRALGPLRVLQTAALREWEGQQKQYTTDRAMYDADLADWKKRGRKAGEPPPEEPDEPEAVRYVCEDTTVEALAVLLEKQPRGLLMARDELSGWVNSFDAYKSCRGADVAHWLSMHRAGPLTVDRKGGRRLIHVPRAAVCVAGGVQPKALAAAMVGRYQAGGVDEAMDKPDKEHFDNGLAARLLFAMPPRLPKKWTEDEPLPGTEATLEALFVRLLGLDFGADSPEPTPIDLPLTPEAKKVWVRFYNEHSREMAEMPSDLAAAWSKLEGYAARFALLVHLIRSVHNDATLGAVGPVDQDSMAAGVALARWFGNETARVYAVIGGSAESPKAREQRELVRIIRAKGGEITARELMRAGRRYRGSVDVAEAELRALVEAGLGTTRIDGPSSRGGRPRVVYVLTDGGDGDRTAETGEECGVVSPSPGTQGAETHAEDATEEEAEWTG